MRTYGKQLVEITYNDWYAIKPNPTKSYVLIYMYKEDLALNNLQWLICHKTKLNQAKSLCHMDFMSNIVEREMRFC